MFSASIIDVHGTPVELRRAGEGLPLLYLHGGGGDSEWIPLLDRLAEDFTVYHPSHPGFGDSGGLEHISGMEDMVLHYVDVIAAVGLKRVPLRVAGSSFGGWIAAELTHRYPNVVHRLVLVAAAGLHLEEAPIAEMFGVEPAELAQRLFYDQAHPLAVAIRSITDPSLLPEAMLLRQFKAMEALAKVAWNPYFHNPKLERRLDRITAPTLVLWGREDRLIPLAHGQRYAARIPHARLEIVEHCGHMAVLEKPDEIYDAISDFCAEGALA